MHDGYTRKLNFKEHPFREQVKQLLAERDLHCVDSIEALQNTPHALTQAGLMSGKTRFFDKQDQKNLRDDWCTGFDNQDRLASLNQQIHVADERLAELVKVRDKHKALKENLAHKQILVEQITHVKFEQIDQAGKEA